MVIVTNIGTAPLRVSVGRGMTVKALYFKYVVIFLWRSAVVGGKNQDS